MRVCDTIARARRRAGLTQEQLAAKVYVTRQAVSRWEMGESEPSVDMRKLLASVLGVPATELFDLPETPACQCCGTPFDASSMPRGTNADGTENQDYCGRCYQNGEFTSTGLDELIERNVPFLMEATGYTAEEAVSFMGAVLPTLKRWRCTQNCNRSFDCRKSVFHVCPSCENLVWSMGEATVNCCGNVLEPLAAKRNDGVLEATVEVVDRCQRVHIVHPMTKQDHLAYIFAIGDDLVRIKRLYPEQEARAEFPLQGPCRLYAYGKACGLVEL